LLPGDLETILEVNSDPRSSNHSAENARCSQIECYTTGVGRRPFSFGDGNYTDRGLLPSMGQRCAVNGDRKQTTYASVFPKNTPPSGNDPFSLGRIRHGATVPRSQAWPSAGAWLGRNPLEIAAGATFRENRGSRVRRSLAISWIPLSLPSARPFGDRAARPRAPRGV
jgi:hypothetical protein